MYSLIFGLQKILKKRGAKNRCIHLCSQQGMTLMEIMVVLILLAGFATIMVTTVMPKLKQAKVSQAKILLSSVSDAIEAYYMDCNAYPNSDQGLEALVFGSEDCQSWAGPKAYLKKGQVPKDPWGETLIYSYEEDTDSFEIRSLGSDKREGGEGLAQGSFHQRLVRKGKESFRPNFDKLPRSVQDPKKPSVTKTKKRRKNAFFLHME